MYISNENPTLVEVYFDDVVMTHTKGNSVQYNEYYPFGLQTANSWTRENAIGNNFLGNGGTEYNTTASLYDLAYRQYDPVLGRMNGVDPMATKYASLTPYNYSFNDPVTFNDPSGADPWNKGPYGGSEAYYYAMNFGSISPGMVPLEIMDPAGGSWIWNPATAGGYSVAGAGLNPHFSAISHMASTWAPNIRGPVYLGSGPDGRSIHALPTEIARAGGAQSYYNISYNLRLSALAYIATHQNGWSVHKVENGFITQSLSLDLVQIIAHTDFLKAIELTPDKIEKYQLMINTIEDEVLKSGSSPIEIIHQIVNMFNAEFGNVYIKGETISQFGLNDYGINSIVKMGDKIVIGINGKSQIIKFNEGSLTITRDNQSSIDIRNRSIDLNFNFGMRGVISSPEWGHYQIIGIGFSLTDYYFKLRP